MNRIEEVDRIERLDEIVNLLEDLLGDLIEMERLFEVERGQLSVYLEGLRGIKESWEEEEENK